MKKKTTALVAVFLISITLIGSVYLQSKNCPAQKIPVFFDENHIPKVHIQIKGKTYPAFLWIRTKYPLTLDSRILRVIEKKDRGVGNVRNIKGETEHTQLYELNNVKFGSWALKRVLAAENESSYNAIEWPLEKANILIDLPHQFICGIQTERQLCEMGIDLKKMKRIPCSVNKKGVFFKGEMDGKSVTFSLATSANYTLVNLNKNLEPNEKRLHQATSHECSLGSYQLHPIEISSEVGAEVILGANFLKDHIIYLDAKNEQLYVGGSSGNGIINRKNGKVRVQLLDSGVPFAEMDIAGTKYRMIIDLGFNGELSLRSLDKILKKLKKLDRVSSSVNLFGEISEAEVYLAENCHVGKIKFPNTVLKHSRSSGALVKLKYKKFGEAKEKEMDGLIGSSFLSRSNLYLNLKRESLQFAKSISEIDIDPRKFEKIPFEDTCKGIYLLTQTDFGTLKLMLDSGSPYSAIKKGKIPEEELQKDSEGNLCFMSSSFGLEMSNWGAQKFFPLRIDDKVGEIDGILGADFLRKNAIYIDFQTKEIWIEKPTSN